MVQIGASFIISGEVLGQRPNSQRRDNFRSIERDTGLEGLLLRPLSAKLLPTTTPESEGIIDREKLMAIQGRSRKPQMELAAHYGITDIPTPSTGCMLTQNAIANRIKDILSRGGRLDMWIAETLKVGRHFRVNEEAKAVVGRNEGENHRLEALFQDAKAEANVSTFLLPEDFTGPAALIIGDAAPDTLETVGGMMLRYAKQTSGEVRHVRVFNTDGERLLPVSFALDDTALEALRIPDGHIAGSYRPSRRKRLRESQQENRV
jgi:hypothetical protein